MVPPGGEKGKTGKVNGEVENSSLQVNLQPRENEKV